MVSRRLIARHRVDFPEPEGPITTTTSPRLIARLMSCSTCKSPNHLFTWSRTTRPLRGAVPCEEAEDEAAVLMPGKLVMGRRITYSRCPRRGCGSVTWYDDASNWSRRSSTTRATELDHPGHGARPPGARTSTTRAADLDHPPSERSPGARGPRSSARWRRAHSNLVRLVTLALDGASRTAAWGMVRAETDTRTRQDRTRTSSEGRHVARTKPLGMIKDVTLGTLLHPVGTAGKAVEQAKGTAEIGRLVAGQVARTAASAAVGTVGGLARRAGGSGAAGPTPSTPATGRSTRGDEPNLRPVPTVNEPAHTPAPAARRWKEASPESMKNHVDQLEPVTKAAKKVPAKKTPAKKSAEAPVAKKAPAKKTPAKKAAKKTAGSDTNLTTKKTSAKNLAAEGLDDVTPA